MEARCDPLSSRKDIDSINMLVHFIMYEHKIEELPLARLPRPMGRWELGFSRGPNRSPRRLRALLSQAIRGNEHGHDGNDAGPAPRNGRHRDDDEEAALAGSGFP